MASRFLLSSPIWSFVGQVHAGGGGQTSVTASLNDQIAASTCGTYCGGGKGVMIRNPYDGYETGGPDGDWLVVPSTFWHNDIAAANTVFPSSGGSVAIRPNPDDPKDPGWGVTSYNVDCPNSGSNGFFDISPHCDTDPGTKQDSPWRYASTGYVIGDAMKDVFMDFDHIQDDDWGWGVFYPTDSNSVDFRCFWVEHTQTWDCPKDPGAAWEAGYIDLATGHWKQDKKRKGPGSHPAGNPYANSSAGGGVGCHFDKRGNTQIDQNDAFDSQGRGLTTGYDCQCNYDMKNLGNGYWSHWLETWVNGATPKKGLESDENWLGPHGAKAPNRALDQVSCWVSNLRDLIDLSNQFWGWRFDWNNQKAPQQNWKRGDANSFWGYWGWNEIPMALKDLTPHEHHQTMFIHLPTSICGNGGGDDSVNCLGAGNKEALETDIDNWVNGPDQFGYLVPGAAHIGNRPGSYVVFVREYYEAENDRWRKWFFCESWSGPLGKYKIVFNPMSGNDGACYVDFGNKYHLYYGSTKNTNVGKLKYKLNSEQLV